MNFFWSEEEASKWLDSSVMADDEDIYCLDIEKAVQEAYETFNV